MSPGGVSLDELETWKVVRIDALPTSAPADTDMVAGQVLYWLDEVADAVKVKAKKSDGTILTGTVATLA